MTDENKDDMRAWLQHLAKLSGHSVSELNENYSLEQLEDMYDALIGEAASKKYWEGDQQTFSMERVMKELDGR